ncbi:MAG: type II toxin-antitoxin system RelE/ParE family toxin [Chitinophagaceae bacterium]|nr:type II toxin-antitoxin system RelE/ParE family toxin [Chitinophagaceae bacterium]
MNFKIDAIPNFKREAKQLVKKFLSLKNELANLEQALQNDPYKGIPLGSNCYKIRLAIESKGKGKRGGARVITYVYIEKTTVYLLTIFDKSEQENLSDKDLKELIKAAKAS